MIGERIKMARHMAGFSQRALAEEAGVSAMAISKYENGLDVPSSGVLIRLAKSLGLKTEFFLRPAGLEVESLAFRCRTSMLKKQEKMIIGQVREWVERYMEAESLLPPSVSFVESLPEEKKRHVSSMEDAEELAITLRMCWGLGLDPIESMIDILEDRGVKVGLFEACREFDACTFFADGEPVIAIADNIPGDRQHFNLAHELGHLVMINKNGLDEEKAAFRFAGAFLVPKESALGELAGNRRLLNLNELYLLKCKYKLSMQGWVYRANDLNIISERFFAEFNKFFRRNGFHIQEPFEQLEPDKPKRMQKIVLNLLAEEIISESKAFEILGPSFDEGVEKSSSRFPAESFESARELFTKSQAMRLFWPITE